MCEYSRVGSREPRDDILVSWQIQSTRDGSCELLHLVTASLGYLIMALDVAGSSGFSSSG